MLIFLLLFELFFGALALRNNLLSQSISDAINTLNGLLFLKSSSVVTLKYGEGACEAIELDSDDTRIYLNTKDIKDICTSLNENRFHLDLIEELGYDSKADLDNGEVLLFAEGYSVLPNALLSYVTFGKTPIYKEDGTVKHIKAVSRKKKSTFKMPSFNVLDVASLIVIFSRQFGFRINYPRIRMLCLVYIILRLYIILF